MSCCFVYTFEAFVYFNVLLGSLSWIWPELAVSSGIEEGAHVSNVSIGSRRMFNFVMAATTQTELCISLHTTLLYQMCTELLG